MRLALSLLLVALQTSLATNSSLLMTNYNFAKLYTSAVLEGTGYFSLTNASQCLTAVYFSLDKTMLLVANASNIDAMYLNATSNKTLLLLNNTKLNLSRVSTPEIAKIVIGSAYLMSTSSGIFWSCPGTILDFSVSLYLHFSQFKGSNLPEIMESFMFGVLSNSIQFRSIFLALSNSYGLAPVPLASQNASYYIPLAE